MEHTPRRLPNPHPPSPQPQHHLHFLILSSPTPCCLPIMAFISPSFSLLSISPLSLPPRTARNPLFSHLTPPGNLSLFSSSLLLLSPLSSPSSSPWLLKVTISHTKPNTLSLLNPLTLQTLKPHHPHFPNNQTIFCVTEITQSFHLRHSDGSPVYLQKLIVLPHNNTTVILLVSLGGFLELFTNPNRGWVTLLGSNSKTTKRASHRSYDINDVILFHNHCYAVDSCGVLLKFDVSDTWNSNFRPVEVTQSLGYVPDDRKYLVISPSGDDLYMFSKVSDPEPEIYWDSFTEDVVFDEDTFDLPVKLKMVKLNQKKGIWGSAGGELDDLAFFLGEDVSFSVSVKGFKGKEWRGNCVYFSDECFWRDEDEDKVYGPDTGFYDWDRQPRLLVRLADSPEYAKLFWPPPPWLNL